MLPLSHCSCMAGSGAGGPTLRHWAVTQGATPLVLPARGMRRSDLSLCWESRQVRTAAYTAPDTLRAAVATIMNMIIIWYRAACTGAVVWALWTRLGRMAAVDEQDASGSLKA